mmetsp:Transcript_12228/g.18758  ORF Transcript_12228/g.18758 Transcript_12228/m.18758 type:complete len:236 (+) Transcript_12228:63-770(+)
MAVTLQGILLLACLSFAKCWSVPKSRRQLFLETATAAALAVATPSPAQAFDNRISNKYDDRPKQRGAMPKDLGLSKLRKNLDGDYYEGLKSCGAAPNCFCSTDSEEDDPEHYIPSWKWPSGMSEVEAFTQLTQTVQSYKPGQNNIDGGGFKVVASKPNYLYVQFESLKNGYVDDVEFLSLRDEVQVRSSSRLGWLDFGVNAKRLNAIAEPLQKQGWKAIGVDYKSHPEYVYQNKL